LEGSIADRKWVGFSVALHGAETIAAANAAFRSFIGLYGLDSFACGSFDALDLARSHYLAVCWPENFSNFYYGEKRLSPDPVRMVIPATLGPVTWSDLLSNSRHARGMRRSIEMTSDFRWRESLIVPLEPPGMLRAMVSMKGPRASLSDAEREILTRAGVAFYQRLRSLEPNTPPREPTIELTGRETECLALVAMGLNDEAIGNHIGVSQGTAHKHVENGKRKLGALNRAHAVAIALRRGVIKA
jgi:LuxR family quorum sensing-dependent transcriptional regulator